MSKIRGPQDQQLTSISLSLSAIIDLACWQDPHSKEIPRSFFSDLLCLITMAIIKNSTRSLEKDQYCIITNSITFDFKFLNFIA